MSIGIILLILLAAVLHASWNALLRAGADRLWSMTIMCTVIAIVCGMLAPFLPLPARASWGYLILSAFFQVGYMLFLVRTYRSADLGQAYPIARGSAPLLVSVAAAVFVGERPDPISMVGILLVSTGIISLAFQGRRLGLDSFPYAVGTGCFIAAYSVTDGIGVRLSGTPVGYTVWLSLLVGVLMLSVYATIRDWRSLIRKPQETWLAAGGGVISLITYGIVIFAMSLGSIAQVSALRETSVVFAALIGRFFLNEQLTASRIAACIIVAIGALCIGNHAR